MKSVHSLALTRKLALVVLLVSSLTLRSQAQVTSEFIFNTAPFASSHASTLVELRDGSVLAAWFGGTAESKPDVAIWSAVRTARGWSAPVELVREPDVPTWNPVLFYSKDGRLWLYYKFGPTITGWTGGRRWSDDDGKTWSPIEHLPAGILGPIKDKPLVLPDGTIVSGSSVESYHSWAVWIERSVDNGRTWTKIGPITVLGNNKTLDETSGIIQPSIVDLGEGHLRLYARATLDIGHICIADSHDGGLTWTPAHPIDLPNPNSGIDAVRLRDGRVVLIYNDTTSGRTPLNLAVSNDGERFHNFLTLESAPGEYSYPAIIQSKDGSLRMTYTWNRKKIRYAEVPLAMVPSN
jgi:predicted neuraminidase